MRNKAVNSIRLCEKRKKSKIEALSCLSYAEISRGIRFPGSSQTSRTLPPVQANQKESSGWKGVADTRFVAADSARLKEPYEVYLEAGGKPVDPSSCDFCHIVDVER